MGQTKQADPENLQGGSIAAFLTQKSGVAVHFVVEAGDRQFGYSFGVFSSRPIRC
jgi:hypothetical protein